MLRRRNYRLTCGIAASVLLACVGCGRPGQKQAQSKRQDTIPVRVRAAARQTLVETLDYAGDVKARDEVLVYPKVSGRIIERVGNEGAAVAQGETLLYIDRDEVGLKFEKAPVQSPLDGYIGRIYVDTGSHVTAQTPVALVVNMRTVRINLNIPEKYLPLVNIGQSAQIGVDAYPDEIFQGKVRQISPVVDPLVRAAPAEILISNDHLKLRSGMFARVSLVIRAHEGAAVVHKESIIGAEPDVYVYVVKDGKSLRRSVTVGIRQGAYCEITDGLTEGDQVVVVGQQQLYDGAPVAVEKGERK